MTNPNDSTAANVETVGSLFLSYVAEEGSYAQRLHDALSALGYDVWLDQKIVPGVAWHDEIQRRLAAASCVIVLWSKRSVRSQWVRYEAALAIGMATYVGCEIEKGVVVPSPYDRLQTSKLTGWDGGLHTAGFPSLIERVRELTSTDPVRPTELSAGDPWPTSVPRAPWWHLSQLAKRNLLGIALTSIAVVAVILVVLGVYRALESQLTKVRNASNELVTKSRETASSVSDLEAAVGKAVSAAGALREDVTEIEARVANVARELQLAALESRPVERLSLIVVFSAPLQQRIRLEIVHADAQVCTVHVPPQSSDLEAFLEGASRDDPPPLFLDLSFPDADFVLLGGRVDDLIRARLHRVSFSWPKRPTTWLERLGLPPAIDWVDMFDRCLVIDLHRVAMRYLLLDELVGRGEKPPELVDLAWPISNIGDLSDVEIHVDPATRRSSRGLILVVNGRLWFGHEWGDDRTHGLNVGLLVEAGDFIEVTPRKDR